MPKVLIISYGFPPVGGAGVQRPAKFVKYLRLFDWEPVVLTVANPSVPVIDEGLLNEIPENVNIYKAGTLEPSYEKKSCISTAGKTPANFMKGTFRTLVRAFLLPDAQILWWPGLIAGLIRVIAKEKPDCLYVTAPPFSSFIPVVSIGRLVGLPVILDYRDEWAFSRNQWENASKTRIAKFFDRLLEKYAVSLCTAYTFANTSYAECIHEKYLGIRRKKFEVITNGFDDDDIVAADSEGQEKGEDGVRILYSGTVWKATSLKPFLAALTSLLETDHGLKSNLSVKIIGRVVEDEATAFKVEILEGVIEAPGYIEHQEIFKELFRADILLLTLSDLHGSHRIITGKVFEYMASGKHILAIIPDGETKKLLIENYDNSTILHPDDVDSIACSIKSLLENIESVRRKKGKDVSQFNRKNLTGKLAGFLGSVVDPRKAEPPAPRETR